VNDTLKLIAQAKAIVIEFNSQDWYEQLDQVIILLDQSVDKLSKV